jgi:hypothetical protein
MKNIVLNEDIHDLLTDAIAGRPLREHPFRKLVEFQINAYKDEGFSIEDKGFQVGEPWSGDLQNARVLFLSSNPAIGVYDKFPRYHAKTRTISWPDGTQLSLPDVEKFFRDRFQCAPMKNGQVLYVEQVDDAGKDTGLTKAIPYWGCVRNTIEKLDLKTVQAKATFATIELYVKALMSRAVIMEIVPFKSNGENGVTEAFYTCARNFTQHLLPHATAPVVILIGQKVRQAFLDFAIPEREWGKAKEAFDNKEAYRWDTLDPKNPKWVIVVDFVRGHFALDVSDKTLQELQQAI